MLLIIAIFYIKEVRQTGIMEVTDIGWRSNFCKCDDCMINIFKSTFSWYISSDAAVYTIFFSSYLNYVNWNVGK